MTKLDNAIAAADAVAQLSANVYAPQESGVPGVFLKKLGTQFKLGEAGSCSGGSGGLAACQGPKLKGCKDESQRSDFTVLL